jgi:predicted NBD/HSP70 family sugar kinase
VNTYLAIDIGGTNTSMAAVSDQSLTDVKTWSTGSCASDVLDQIRRESVSLVTEHTFDACGIGFGGQFDFVHQRVMRSVHVSGWEGMNLTEWANDVFGIPAIADNDANVGGLGEARLSAGREFASVVYLTISTGIGGAFIMNGSVQRGSHDLAGEFGHLTLDPNGPECGCGLRGCAERMLSGLWLKHDHGVDAEQLLADQAFMMKYANDLSGLLQQITMVLDPEVFVLGGGIGASSDVLALRVQEALRDRLYKWDRPTPQVRRAAFGGNSVLIGAGQLAKDRYGAAG